MNTNLEQLSITRNNKDLVEMYKTFEAIEDTYNSSLVAMGLKTVMPSLSGNTSIGLTNTVSISTRC